MREETLKANVEMTQVDGFEVCNLAIKIKSNDIPNVHDKSTRNQIPLEDILSALIIENAHRNVVD